MDLSQQFRKAATNYNCDACAGKPYHYFDLYGSLYSAADASSVKGLVELACCFTPPRGRCLHTDLLELVAKRDELALFVAGTKPVINWWRPDQFQAELAESPASWLTLQERLREQEQEPELEPVVQFGRAAIAAGLAYSVTDVPKENSAGFWHLFILRFPNDGRLMLYAKPEPEQLKALVELGRAYSVFPKAFGPHLSLLAMVARPANLEAFEAGRDQYVSWSAISAKTPDKSVTLRSWLASHGQVFGEEYDGIFHDALLAFAHELPDEGKVTPATRLGIYSSLSPFGFGHLEQSGSIGDFDFHERPLATESALAELLRDGDLESPYKDKLLTITEKPDEEALLLEQILGGGAMANLDPSKLLLVTTDGEETIAPPLSADEVAVEEAVASLIAEGREVEAYTAVAIAVDGSESGKPVLLHFSVGGRLNGK